MSVKPNLAKILPLAFLSACSTTSPKMLYETNAIPASSVPQVCKDYKSLLNKEPNWQRFVQTGAIGVATREAVQIFSNVTQKEANAAGGIAALGDIAFAKMEYNRTLESFRNACNTNIQAILNGQLCTTRTNESAGTNTRNGQTGTYTGNIYSNRNCTGVGQTGRAPGLANY